MKKNRLVLVIVIIGIILAGAFFLSRETGTADPDNGETENTHVDIGILQTTSHQSLDDIREGIIQGLEENGYTDGENATIHFQNAQGDQSQMNTMATTFVEDNVDIMIGIGTPASQALANASQNIPIIMGAVSDPVGSGLVESDEAPGGNVTGVKNVTPIAAQLELLREIAPDMTELGLLYSSGEDNSQAEGERAAVLAEELGFEPKTYKVSNSNDIAQMVATMSQEVEAIYLPTDNTIASAMETVVNEANRYNIPLIPTVDQMIQQGGFATVGINQTEMGVEAGRMAAEVLNGDSDPATTPTFVLEEGEVLVNEEQAERLGIEIPQSVLDRARIVETTND